MVPRYRGRVPLRVGEWWGSARHVRDLCRYGHPEERPIYASSIDETEMVELCVSYLEHGFSSGGDLRADDFTWADYAAFNRRIDWAGWRPSLLRASSSTRE